MMPIDNECTRVVRTASKPPSAPGVTTLSTICCMIEPDGRGQADFNDAHDGQADAHRVAAEHVGHEAVAEGKLIPSSSSESSTRDYDPHVPCRHPLLAAFWESGDLCTPRPLPSAPRVPPFLITTVVQDDDPVGGH